jgi:hypothetical protein
MKTLRYLPLTLFAMSSKNIKFCIQTVEAKGAKYHQEVRLIYSVRQYHSHEQCCGSEIIFPDPALTLIPDPDCLNTFELQII